MRDLITPLVAVLQPVEAAWTANDVVRWQPWLLPEHGLAAREGASWQPLDALAADAKLTQGPQRTRLVSGSCNVGLLAVLVNAVSVVEAMAEAGVDALATVLSGLWAWLVVSFPVHTAPEVATVVAPELGTASWRRLVLDGRVLTVRVAPRSGCTGAPH